MGILFIDMGEVRTFDVGRPMTIGRDSTNDIIVAHPTVSRNHARIDTLDGRYVLTDFNSRNGTRVNGKAVDDSESLQDGARLRIGHVRAWFFLKMPNKLPRSVNNRDVGICFNCACGQRLWSASDTIGMSVACNACNQSVEVPKQSTSVVDGSAGTVAGVSVPRANEKDDARATCGICQWPIEADEALHKCIACGTFFHEECWRENHGCSTYGCVEVNAAVPKKRPATPSDVAPAAAAAPVIESAPTAPAAKPFAWAHMLLGLSVVGSLLGLLAFGVPAAVVGLIAAVRLLVTKTESRSVLAAAVVIALLGVVAGVMISRLWWFNIPLFG